MVVTLDATVKPADCARTKASAQIRNVATDAERRLQARGHKRTAVHEERHWYGWVGRPLGDAVH
jgi:hypothetical protein